MKKRYLLLTILPIFGLVGCNNNEELSLVESNIQTLSNGFKMEGNITQTRIEGSVDYNGNFIAGSGEPETNTYKTNFVFQGGDEIGYQKTSTSLLEGVELTMEDYLYYCDDEGYAYEKQLNYQNQVENVYPLSFGRKVPFYANGFYNPFLILDESDFTQDTTNTARYYLDLGKASIIANNLLYSLNSGFYGRVENSYFIASQGNFTIFTITMSPRVYAEFDNASYTTKYYQIDNTVTFTISEPGSAKVSTLNPVEAKNNTELQSALNTIQDNFTLTITETDETKIQKFYFDGSTIYNHTYREGESAEPNPETDYYLAQKADTENGRLVSYVYNGETTSWEEGTTTEFPEAYQDYYYYSDYLPIIGGVSADLFTYDREHDLYVSDAIALSALTDCFIVNTPPYRNSNASNASTVSIRLNSSNQIDYVLFSYGYIDELTGTVNVGEITLTYEDIGTTENPAL